MIRNYFKIAWRNLIKNKIYTVINLTGLTIGMTCFILITLFIQFELSYDQEHEKSDRIFRVVQQQVGNEYRGTDFFALAPNPLGVALKEDYPQVEAVTNINQSFALLVNENKSFSEQGILTDKHIFDVFTIPVLQGDPKKALEDPNSIVLTESLALKIFGSISVIDRSILFERNETLTVKGVIADPPKNQHLNYNFLISYKTRGNYANDIGNWASNNYHSYLALAPGHDYSELQKNMERYDIIAKKAYENEGFDIYPKYGLQPLKDIHLYSKMNGEIGANSDIKYVYFFAIIALVILILASINYMNLATAKSAQRGKEVGIGKVLGARKIHLIFQFLGESFLFTFFSLLIASFLAILILPYFNILLGREIPFNIVSNWWITLGMLSIAIFVGVLSGLYPAIFLSRVTPEKALKGNFLKSHKEGSSLRNSLVIGQFVVAIVLAIGSIIVHKQLSFISNKNLGYSKEQVIHVPYFEKEIAPKENLIKTQLLKHPKINKVSISTQLPMNLTSQGPVTEWEGKYGKDELWVYRAYVDYDFIDLFEIEILEGRGFSREFASDSTEAYILNESAVEKLGWKTAVGKKFHDGRVIGVIKDFHLQKFDLSIEPLYLTMRSIPQLRNFGEVIVKTNLDDFENTRAHIEKTMKSIVPLAFYRVNFMEESYAALYASENKLSYAFNIFTLLALFIAAMGLFGLVSFHVVQRSKEIGIRKVLGSSVKGIVNLLLKDFIKLILVALIAAVPISYYLMENWLQNYVYRIEINGWIFIMAGIVVLLVAICTIGFQAIKVAVANPVNSLRSE